MSVVTLYVCDRCNYSSGEYDQMWKVGVAVGSMPAGIRNYASSIRHEVLWCRPCCDALHLIRPDQAPPEQVQLSPSERLEALIKEMIQDELDNR